MATPAAVYHPRHPRSSDYYRCVEEYFETFVQVYDHFSRQYGFWRPYIQQVINSRVGVLKWAESSTDNACAIEEYYLKSCIFVDVSDLSLTGSNR